MNGQPWRKVFQFGIALSTFIAGCWLLLVFRMVAPQSQIPVAGLLVALSGGVVSAIATTAGILGMQPETPEQLTEATAGPAYIGAVGFLACLAV